MVFRFFGNLWGVLYGVGVRGEREGVKGEGVVIRGNEVCFIDGILVGVFLGVGGVFGV